jgi:hypothetical protein
MMKSMPLPPQWRSQEQTLGKIQEQTLIAPLSLCRVYGDNQVVHTPSLSDFPVINFLLSFC